MTSAVLSDAFAGTVSLVATDSGSGVAETLYSLDGGVLTTGTVVLATGDGTHTVQFWSVDNASNVETPALVAFLVDETAPHTSSDASASYVDSATITLTANDNDGGVGVAETRYILDTDDVATGTAVTVSTAGAHTLQFWSVDAVGNTEATQSVSFTITASQARFDAPPPDIPGVTVGPGALGPVDVSSLEVRGWPSITGLAARAAAG
jgi:hypothetical protein